MTEGVVRFGVLGAARIAPPALLRPAAGNARAVVQAVAARDRGRAEDFARRHGIPEVLDSYESLVSHPDVDAIYIPLPNGLHGRWTMASLAAGKHVLCEKPFTSNAPEAQLVAEAARRAGEDSGIVVAEAFHYRYHPFAQRMADIVTSGELGRVSHVEAWLCAPIPKKSDIRYQYDLAGGALMDMGCYVVNIVRMLAGGEPQVLSASAKLQTPDVDRAMKAELQFPGGPTGAVHCSMWSSSFLHVGVRVTGEEGEMRVLNPFSPQALSILRVRSDGRWRTEIPSRRPTYTYQLEAFCDAVLEGKPVLTSPADAVANMRVIDAIYLAAGMQPRGT
jgi:predicted dehydrogenase